MNKAKIIWVAFAVVMASLLVSCQKEKLVDNISASEVTEYPFTVELDPETKTGMFYSDSDKKWYYNWTGGETLAISEVRVAPNKTDLKTTESNTGVYWKTEDGKTEDTDRMNFSVTLSTWSGTYTYYSVYPYSAHAGFKYESGKLKLSVNLPEVQNPLADNFDPAADILVSQPYEGRPKGDDGFAFTFNRHSVGIKMKIRNFKTEEYDVEIIQDGAKTGTESRKIYFEDTDEYVGERVEKITITSANSKISGTTTFEFVNGDIPPKTDREGDSNRVILDYSSIIDEEGHIGLPIKNTTPEGETNTVGNEIFFTTWPFTVSESSPLTVEVQTTNYIFTKTIKRFSSNSQQNSWAFTRAHIALFNANFSNASVKTVDHPKPVIPSGDYVVSWGGMSMVAEKDDAFLLAKTEAQLPLEKFKGTDKDGKTDVYNINDAAPLTAVWNFEYDKISGKYRISSVNKPDKYLKGASDQSLTLVAKNEASLFSIEKNDGYYNLYANKRYLGCKSRFSMLREQPDDNTKLSLTKVNLLPTIKVVSSYGISSEGGDVSIPVTLFSVPYLGVKIEGNDDKLIEKETLQWDNGESSIKFHAAKNNDFNATKTATIKIFEADENGVEKEDGVKKEIKVTQHHRLYYATLSYAGDVKTVTQDEAEITYDKSFTCTQANGAKWEFSYAYDTDSPNSINITKGLGYIKLPDFSESAPIKTVTVILTNATNYVDRIIGLYSSKEASEPVAQVETVAGVKTYVIPVEEPLTTAYLKSTTLLRIGSVKVDARTTHLPAPTGLATAKDTKTLSWNKVEGAVAYDVTVGTKTVKNVEGTSCTIDIADEWYDVTVVAKADPESQLYIDSEPSTANLKFGAPQLNKPEQLQAGAKQTTLTVTWAINDTRADQYVCTISPALNPENAIASKTVTGNVVEFTDLTPNKDYKVTVKAVCKVEGDEKKYSDSDGSVITIKTATIELKGKGSATEPYTVSDAIAINNDKDMSLAGKYVEGTVTGTPVFNEDDMTMTYTITDGTETLPVTGKDLGGDDFSSAQDLPVDSEVVIYYTDNTTNNLYSIGGKTSILTGIEVDKRKTKLSYEYGEAFVNPVVYASYRGAEKKEVTGFKVKNSENKEMSAKVTKSVKLYVSYTENGITKSAEYDINVVKFTHSYAIPAFTGSKDTVSFVNNGGIKTTLVNFCRTNKDYVRGLTDTNRTCSVTTDKITETINNITFELYKDANRHPFGISDKAELTIKQDGNTIKTIPDIQLSSSTTINLEGNYTNCTFSLEFSTSPENKDKRLDIKSIVFENIEK